MTYCSKCGKEVESGASYCSYCGAAMTGQTERHDGWIDNYGPNSPNNSGASYAPAGLGNMLTNIYRLGILWAIVAILLGIFYIDGVNIIFGADLIMTIGVMSIISGIFALLTSVLIIIRKGYIVAFILCLVGSILAIIFIVGIIGLFFAYQITKEKDRFTS